MDTERVIGADIMMALDERPPGKSDYAYAKKSLAMTGEIPLRGKVLPVGGIKEKILAAKRANIKEIILCHENKRDIDEIKQEYLEGLTFHYVKEMSEVLALAITDQNVKNAKVIA